MAKKKSAQPNKKTIIQTTRLKCPITKKTIWVVKPNDGFKDFIGDSTSDSDLEACLIINPSFKQKKILQAVNSITSANAGKKAARQKLWLAMQTITSPDFDTYNLAENPDDFEIVELLETLQGDAPTNIIVTYAQLQKFESTLKSNGPGPYKSEKIQQLEKMLKETKFNFYGLLKSAPDADRYAFAIDSLIEYLELEPKAFAEDTLDLESIYTLYTHAKIYDKAAMLKGFLLHNETMKEKYAALFSAVEDIYRQEAINLKISPEERETSRLIMAFEKAEANIDLATQITTNEALTHQVNAQLKQIEALQKDLKALHTDHAQAQQIHSQHATDSKLRFQTKISEYEEKIKTHTAKINDYLQKEAQQSAEINQLKSASNRLEDQHAAITKELEKLRSELATNKRQLRAERSQATEQQSSPNGYPQIVTAPSELFPSIALVKDWADAMLPGKMIIHPRAVRAASQSQYQNPADIYKALSLLGNDYRTMKLDGSLRINKELTNALKVLGMDLVRSISPNEMGRYTGQYNIIQDGEKLTLNSHIRKGKAQNPQTTMRIYFPSDLHKDQVVIASLTGHLDNSLG